MKTKSLFALVLILAVFSMQVQYTQANFIENIAFRIQTLV